MSAPDTQAFVAEIARRALGEEPRAVAIGPEDTLQASLAAAWTHVDPAAAPITDLPRRILRKGMGRFHNRQEQFNRSVLSALQELNARVDLRIETTGRSIAEIERLSIALSERVDDLFNRLMSLDHRVAKLDTDIGGHLDAATTERDELEVQLTDLTRTVNGLRTELKLATSAAERAAAGASAGRPAAPAAPAAEVVAPSVVTEEFYAALEDRFRGDRSHVLATHRAHEDILDRAPIDAEHPVVDAGCGRGEWLELLAEKHLPAIGVDTSELFIEQCRHAGFDAVVDDAVSFLLARPPESLGLVSAFHLIEHLSLDVLAAFFDAALRALRPGGILLVETPNPLNVVTGAAHFYLDPTHERPLHPEFVRFLAKRQGFASTEVRFLGGETDGPTLADLAQPDENTLRAYLAEAHKHLFGAQNYAVVATRA